MNNKQKEMCIAIKEKKNLLSLAIISQTPYNLKRHKAKGKFKV